MCGPGHKGHDDLTSSPPSSDLSPAVLSESPPLRVGNRQQGLRSLKNLISHFTARADDSHATPVHRLQAADLSLSHPGVCQALVRFLAYHRIKPHAPPLVRAPVNSFEFHPSRLSVSTCPDVRLRHRCSSRYLQISPLHLEFQHPLLYSRYAVSNASRC